MFQKVDKNNDMRHYAQYEQRKKAHESRPGSLRALSIGSTVQSRVTIGPITSSAMLQKCFVRWKMAIRNHLFCALRAFP
jgi:hypothetical protein